MKFKIENVNVFFIGLIVLFVGIFIVIFDHRQIHYFEKLNQESYQLLDEETKNIHQRLKIEYSIGVLIFLVGIGTIVFSVLKNKFAKSN